jgi:AbrB family looped-hinge helix DNA binding protein
MACDKPFRAHIRDRGQLTIPKEVRDKGALQDGAAVTIIPVGDAILVGPNKLGLEEARREMRRIMREAGLTPKDLLEGLEGEKAKLFEESYGEEDV